MKNKTTVRLKAVFLLFVFLLNTVVGFACATGMEDMSGHGDSSHHHAAKENKDNCCKDEVAKLVKADNVFPAEAGLKVQPLSFFIIVPSFYQFDASTSVVINSKPKYFVRRYHLPIPDIRIGMQSFQI